MSTDRARLPRLSTVAADLAAIGVGLAAFLSTGSPAWFAAAYLAAWIPGLLVTARTRGRRVLPPRREFTDTSTNLGSPVRPILPSL